MSMMSTNHVKSMIHVYDVNKSCQIYDSCQQIYDSIINIGSYVIVCFLLTNSKNYLNITNEFIC